MVIVEVVNIHQNCEDCGSDVRKGADEWAAIPYVIVLAISSEELFCVVELSFEGLL